jgi:hypothetical protein
VREKIVFYREKTNPSKEQQQLSHNLILYHLFPTFSLTLIEKIQVKKV